MSDHKVFSMEFSKIYSLYVQKAKRKNRTEEEVIQIICWLTGFNSDGLSSQVDGHNDLATFFAEAPAINPNASLIKGTVCGVRIEEVEDTLMRNIRYLDKLIDELAKGKSMDKILRS
ncbi:DUF2200 domain-containing protein [Agaribacterium sp. ZY112]|uniref:DUF2200 domain-containing protein n=1 Tax=Agaribacterium sp. ZY112 TaxID=3233574 RepID=UPI0035233003